MGETIQEMVERVTSYRTGAAAATMIALGDRLGLYRAMRGAGPVTAQQLVDRLGVRATEQLPGMRGRWLQDWLLGQAAAGLVECLDGDRFLLTEAGAEVLADEDSLASRIGSFASVAVQARQMEAASLAFDSGVVDLHGWEDPQSASAVERARRPWVAGVLVRLIVPALSGVADRLAAGARVADLCCGSALALRELAAAHPHSRFTGYDDSPEAVDRGNRLGRSSGLGNVELRLGDATAVAADGPYDLLLTLDAMHELAHPDLVAVAARAAIADDGVWLIEDPHAPPAEAGDPATLAAVAAQYATSVLVCLPRSLPYAGARAMGAYGFTEHLARMLTAAAGFSRFRAHEFGSVTYRHFEVRP